MSTATEQSSPLLHDAVTDAYLDRVAQALASESKSRFAIKVRVIDSDDVYAETLPGGYQYLTRGLLLLVHDECELASALARGVAHTALRSETTLQTKANLMQALSIPIILGGVPAATSTRDPGLATPLTFLKFQREDELAADYLGVQYVYKAGYETSCFESLIMALWPAGKTGPISSAFSVFPRTEDRIKALDKEIAKRLPNRSTDVVNTPEFDAFRAHLLTLPPAEPDNPALRSAPSLRRVDSH